MTRQRRALGNPPYPLSGLSGFPRWNLTTTRTLFRAHSTSHGPWWFATARGAKDDGRFDLPDPDGTCYLASTQAGAIRERWGRNLVRRGYVMAADADTTEVSVLTVTTKHRLADTVNSKAASYGVTRELGTVIPYGLPQAWAVAFHDVGCAGIRYEPRFSTGPRDLAYAIFGDKGPRTWPGDPSPLSGRTAATRAGLRVVDPPRRVKIASPPL
jgi:hypothetical protein